MSDRRTQIDKAKKLIVEGVSGQSGVWADIGCGDGIYTSAVLELLIPGATIYAVDRDKRALKNLEKIFTQEYSQSNSLITMQADFSKSLDFPNLDGIVMANSLHFVEDKQSVLGEIIKHLKPGGRLIIVEYNTNRGNRWVPYPFNEQGFIELAERLKMQDAQILNKIRSSFLGEFYAGMAFSNK